MKSVEEIRTFVVGAITEETELAEEELYNASNLTDLGIDSIDVVCVVSMIEDEYDIEIDLLEGSELLDNNINEVAALLQKKIEETHNA